MPDPVRAAGGLLYRRSDGRPEVCVVHRARYDDWSLPKGKLRVGEHPVAGAVREVAEETGVRGRPQLLLPPVEYVLPNGRPKTVDFWLMRAEDHPVDPAELDQAEVDQVRWLPVDDAVDRVGYPDDRRLLEHFAELPPVSAVAGLLRHGHAGDRRNWPGPDHLRPLDDVGRAQAERFAEICVLLRPQQLVTATPLRCKQTHEPLAALLGLPIVLDDAFTEPPEARDAPVKAKAAMHRLLELRSERPPVICSQGKVIPHLLAALRDEADPEPYETPKGGGWVLTWGGDRLLGLSRI